VTNAAVVSRTRTPPVYLLALSFCTSFLSEKATCNQVIDREVAVLATLRSEAAA
jgi:hypothetical protein